MYVKSPPIVSITLLVRNAFTCWLTYLSKSFSYSGKIIIDLSYSMTGEVIILQQDWYYMTSWLCTTMRFSLVWWGNSRSFTIFRSYNASPEHQSICLLSIFRESNCLVVKNVRVDRRSKECNDLIHAATPFSSGPFWLALVSAQQSFQSKCIKNIKYLFAKTIPVDPHYNLRCLYHQ